MADVVDPATRSRMMAGIKATNTKPELALRHGLHALGFRYRLHNRQLPGTPDIVLPKHRAVIFVNGCFWHGHDCELFRWPKTRPDFWREKIGGNMARDRRNHGLLITGDWRVLDVWECAMKGSGRLELAEVVERTAAWLTSDNQAAVIRGH